MLENLILWLIIGAAAVYVGRSLFRTFSGRTKGCGCGSGSDSSPPQQFIPDLKDKPPPSSKPAP